MKEILLIFAIISGMFVIPVQAQTTSEFGYQLHPEKLLENTVGTLQVFVTSNDMIVPKITENLKVVSSDNSIIEVIGVEEGKSKFIKNVLIKAKEPGITNIVLAAQGFSSKEITLEVFNNNNHPTQILMKVTPETFTVDGPRFGHIAFELATTAGLPTKASEDITIHLETPHKDVIQLKNSEIIIPAGEYYAIEEFNITGYGDGLIFAETEGMKKISKIVKVPEAIRPLQLQLYVYPENFNSFSGTTGFAIIQLLDGEGEPVIAEEDINFKLSVENPNISINTSHDFEEVSFDQKQLVIEKGSYSTYTQFTPTPNLGDFTTEFSQSFNMFIAAENILTSGDSFTVTHDQIGALEGEGPSITKVLPFLTTGKKEIIGVTYYETDIEVSRQLGTSTAGSTNRELVTVTIPVQAKDNHEITFSSSELDTVKPIHPTMKKGQNAVIVFGETGTVAPEGPVNFYITDNEGVKTVGGNPIGPIEDDLTLIVEPLIPMILADSKFPVIAYLDEGAVEDAEVVVVTEEGGEDAEVDPRLGATPFIEDAILTFSANEFIETDTVSVKQNQPYALIEMTSNGVGGTPLSYQMSGFEGEMTVTSHTTDPAEIHLSFSKNMLAESNTLATIQLLDSGGNPVYVKKDIIVKLVSNDNQVLKTPEEVIVQKGSYFTTFEIETLNEGGIELALLSEDFSLTKYEINVIDISPQLSLALLGGLNWNERIEAKLSVTIPGIITSLDGFDVEWEVDGGKVVQFDEVTNTAGIATLNVIADDKEKVLITAIVSGNGLSSATLSKAATILNMPIDESNTVVEESSQGFDLPIDLNLIILIAIPVGIGATLFMLKRMDKLDLITEKIPMMDKLNIGDKIDEIKERVMDIKNR